MTLSNLSQYGINFQIKVLSSLLTHKEFLLNIHDVISEDYFDNQAHKWIIKEILKYYDKLYEKGANNRENPTSIIRTIALPDIDPTTNAKKVLAFSISK